MLAGLEQEWWRLGCLGAVRRPLHTAVGSAAPTVAVVAVVAVMCRAAAGMAAPPFL